MTKTTKKTAAKITTATNTDDSRPMKLSIDRKTTRTYATEAGLMEAIELAGWSDHSFVVVRNRAGRFTAIFPASQIQNDWIMRYAAKGFLTIG